MYFVTKTYGHDLGWSVTFRQWRAPSHCSQLHGYALAFKFVFACEDLDENHWGLDFGSLKPLRRQLEDAFDHQTIVAADDPHLELFRDLDRRQIIHLKVLPNVGCEAFAEHAHDLATKWLAATPHAGRVIVDSVEVREHGSNAAIYKPNGK